MLDLADFEQGQTVLDVGMGDGRVLIRAIQRGASMVEGWESQDEVFHLSRAHVNSVLTTDQSSKCKLVHGNGILAPFGSFDVIVLYLLPAGLKVLSPYIHQAIKSTSSSSCKIISQGWPIEAEGIKIVSSVNTSGGSTLYRHEIPQLPY